MIAYLLTLVLAASLFSGLGIGIVPFILLVAASMIAFRGIVYCMTLMLDSFASFFGISRDDSLRIHVMIGATLLFPPVLPFMFVIAYFTFRNTDHA